MMRDISFSEGSWRFSCSRKIADTIRVNVLVVANESLKQALVNLSIFFFHSFGS